MTNSIKKIVVVGGGTAGWMAAALLKKVLGNTITLELVESDAIGAIGVGEATIPPIQHVNSVLGFNEAEFLKKTGATLKLAIRFENWKSQGQSYYHTFGAPGQSRPFCHFHHYWLRAKTLGDVPSIWDFDLNYLAAKNNKFAKVDARSNSMEFPYAYHFDASLYAKFLRELSEAMGVTRTEGLVEEVKVNAQNGSVEKLRLNNGKTVEGDFFIDCSGFRGLLIQQTLNAGYDDWSHWLPCDRAIAVPSQRFDTTLPFTRSIAHSAGWQWRIPLQHRNGNGLVFSSSHYSDDEAQALLLGNLESERLADAKVISFRTGRRRKQWSKNVLAVGLSSGFLEPLESTSIHLIQSAVVRLLKLFPHNGVTDALVEEYNTQSKREYEQIRDFIILHYHLNERDDSDFWRDLRRMDIPDSLSHKIELFRSCGIIVREQEDLFTESSWLQVMMGQGIMPRDYHPFADKMSEQELHAFLNQLLAIKSGPVMQMPSHDAFLEKYCQL